MNVAPLLEISDLRTSFKSDDGYLAAVSDFNLTVNPGETVGLVGESGCGKSVTSLSIMRLLPQSAKVEGSIRLEGRDLLEMRESEVRKLRGNEVSMIFQEPMTALNPILRVADQISEPLRMHKALSKRAMRDRVLELLAAVGIPRPAQIASEYPHQLSGGMRQRVMIAMAMACEPKLLIADEPTTALDVTVQAQILDLLRKLQQENNMALLLITHDLGVVAEMCERVVVMYAGKVIEEGNVRPLFKHPQHPYTQGLLNSIPKITGEIERLTPIQGNVPSLAHMPTGCRFAPRCPHVMDVCRTDHPKRTTVAADYYVNCWLAERERAL
jgi:oligopeptide/dipeptide ABC transporter ATP-binding protein